MVRGLAPVGLRSGPLHFFRLTELSGLRAASQPNGGKPPRHKGIPNHGVFLSLHRAVTLRGFDRQTAAVGGQISAKSWELLLAMLVFEAAFGLPGVVAGPIYYAYLKSELKQVGMV